MNKLLSLLFALVATQAQAFDPSRYTSPIWNAPQVDKIIIQGQGSTGDASGFTATTRSVTDNSTRLATTAFVQAIKSQRAVNFGTSVVPKVEDPFLANLTVTSGSKIVTVNSTPVTIRVGMTLWLTPPPFPPAFGQEYGVPILAVNGNQLTIRDAANTSATFATAQIGQNRWDLTSNLLANTGGFSKLHVGFAATSGNSLAWFGGGYELPDAYSALVVSPNGRNALVTASRSSDSNGAYGATLVHASYAYNDRPAATTWNKYTETHVAAGVETSQTLGEESSLENKGLAVAVDPFTFNSFGMTGNLRLDCGVGFDTQPCSTAIDIGPNPMPYFTGINFISKYDVTGGGSTPDYRDGLTLKAGRSYKEAIALGPNHGLVWYKGANAPAWTFTSTATTGTNNTFLLQDNAIAVSADIRAGGASNFAGVDRMVSVNGATSSALGTMVGGAPAVSLASAAGYSAMVDNRSVDYLLGTGGAATLTLRANTATRFVPQASLPTSPLEGDCVWDGPAHKLKCFDGTIWQAAW